jgi:hypothetical protein
MPESILTIANACGKLDAIASEGPLVLLPSSGALEDRAARDVASLRALRGLPTRIAVPSWRARFRDGADSRVLAMPRIGIVDAAAIDRQGPLVIDLPAMYMSPMKRTRLLTSRDRPRAVIDTFRRWPLAATVIRVADDLWLETRDPIVAELVAITARDLRWPEPEGLTPWEDELVQVATEYDLGARVPREITCRLLGDVAGDHHMRFVMALHVRVGVDIPLN